jgi:putative membrane protein
MESASTTNKKHATITYAPNQKSNYLASQIINNVVSAVEKNLDNTVNSTIVDSLASTIKDVPSKLETISNGFEQLEEGTTKLQDGSNSLANGTNSLKSNYEEFNTGIKNIKDGIETLNSSTANFSSLSSGLNELVTGAANIKAGNDQFSTGFNAYVSGVNTALNYTDSLVTLINASICPKVQNNTATKEEIKMCAIAQGMSTPSEKTGNTTTINYLKISGQKLQNANTSVSAGINELNNKVTPLLSVNDKIKQLQGGVNTLLNGANTLYDSSLQIRNGIATLNDGATTLNAGIKTLNSSVKGAKEELNTNITTTKEEVKKVDNLSDYSKEPVTVKTKAVNEISSYGTAFSPFFISIALWVGCLMMYIVLYYDKEERFKKLSISNKNRLQRTLCYHGLATLSAIILGILLMILLDFEITNIFLYFISIILVANTFMAIIETLIINFKDIGKFIALILLVLQLAAAGGTFPIETVTKGFRFLNPILPMTYTINLLRESLVTIEKSLLTKNILVVVAIMIVFMSINIIVDITKQKKESK